MRIIAEAVTRGNARIKFYIAVNAIIFEYREPFETDMADWSKSVASFPVMKFRDCINSLNRMNTRAEIEGMRGENLLFIRNPDGTVDLNLTGCKDGSDILVPAVSLPTSHMLATIAKGDTESPIQTTERYERTFVDDVLGQDP